MATYRNVVSRSARADADLSALQYHFTRSTGARTVNVASEASGGANDCTGVLQNKPTSGQAATIGYFGESKIVAGGAVTVNTFVTTNGSGRATAAGSGDLVMGVALDTAGADGEVITMQLSPAWRLTGAV